MMPDSDPLPPPSQDPQNPQDPHKPNRTDGARFDGASVPRSHTQAASRKWTSPEAGFRRSADPEFGEAVRDVSIEALLYRLDEALAAIRSLDAEFPSSDSPASDEAANPGDRPR